jgi:hypothetical protein
VQADLFKYSEQELIRNLRNVNVHEVPNKDFDFKTDYYSSTLKNATKNMVRYPMPKIWSDISKKFIGFLNGETL